MSSTSIPKYSLITLFMVVATELIGFGLIIPILPQIASSFDVPWLWVGILLSAYSFAQFFAAPILGSLSDRYGRKPILILSKLGTCLAYVVLAMSNSFIPFLIARLLDGFTGGNIAVARAYIADVTSAEDRPKGMAVIGISFGVGFILGPALGGFLYGIGKGHAPAALVAGGLSFVALLFTVFLLKEPNKRVERPKRSLSAAIPMLRQPLIRFFCGAQLLYMIVFAGFETTFAVFTYQLFQFTEQQNSWLFMFAGIMALVVQGYITQRSSKRLGLSVTVGMMVISFGFAAFALSSEVWQLLVTLALFSIGIGFVNSYFPALFSVVAKSENEGASMGIYESLGSLGRIIGPTLAYLSIFEVISTLYVLYAALMSFLALAFLSVSRFKLPKEHA